MHFCTKPIYFQTRVVVPKTLVQIHSDTSNTGNILVYLFFFNKLLQTSTKLNAVMVLNLDEWISKLNTSRCTFSPKTTDDSVVRHFKSIYTV